MKANKRCWTGEKAVTDGKLREIILDERMTYKKRIAALLMLHSEQWFTGADMAKTLGVGQGKNLGGALGYLMSEELVYVRKDGSRKNNSGAIVREYKAQDNLFEVFKPRKNPYKKRRNVAVQIRLNVSDDRTPVATVNTSGYCKGCGVEVSWRNVDGRCWRCYKPAIRERKERDSDRY